jgi:DNA repair protein RadD
MKLRPYQEQAIQDLRVAFRQGTKRACLVLSTGSGKTVVAASMIRSAISRGSNILFLAHRRELINQTSAKLDLLQVDHGVIMGDHPRRQPWSQVQVASVPTLAKRMARLGTVGALHHWKPKADLIFVDEAHHCAAESYLSILRRFPKAVCVGLTATPVRRDGRGLGELFEVLVRGPQAAALIELGHLVPITGFSYLAPSMAEIQALKHKKGDYSEKDQARAMSHVILCGEVVTQWKRHARGKRTVAFAVNVEQSQALVKEFVDAGVRAEHVDAKTPSGERDAILGRLASGEVEVVSNCAILTEGWDSPKTECVILARPTASEGLALQMTGRGLRPACLDCGEAASWKEPTCPSCGSANVKRSLRIHDHARVLDLHGLPDEDREYTLDSASVRERGSGLKTCPFCHAMAPAGASNCSNCRMSFPKPPEGAGHGVAVESAQTATQVDLEVLRAIRERVRMASLSERAGEYKRLLAVAEAKGFLKGWAAHQYRAAFGDWPAFGDRYLDQIPTRTTPFLPAIEQRRLAQELAEQDVLG